MSSNSYIVEDNPSVALNLSGLTKTEEVDCSLQSHIETVNLSNCPAVNRIHFGVDFLNNPRSFHIHGDWSGSIHVNGAIRSLEFTEANHQHDIFIGNSRRITDPRMRTGENGLITNSLSELKAAQGHIDDLLYLSDDDAPSHVEIGLSDGLPFRHLGLSGHSKIESLTIHCLDGGAQSIVINNLPNLQSIKINGQTRLLEVERCPRLHYIHGQGDLIRAKSYGGSRLTVSGIWDDIDSAQSLLRRTPDLSELRNCSDIAWAHIPALEYEVQVKWAEKFDLDIMECCEGVPIQKMIEIMSINQVDFLECIEEWTLWLMTPSEQYIAMRLVTALCLSSDIPKESIWKARDGILASNKRFFNVYGGDDTVQRFSRSQNVKTLKSRMKNWFELQPKTIRNAADARYGLGLSSWSLPSASMLPMDRLDIEIWVETGGVSMFARSLMPQEVLNRYRTNRQSTFIDAVLHLRDKGEARNRQDGLTELMFNWLQNSHQGNLFDQIAQLLVEYGVGRIPEVVNNFIDALLHSNIRERAKIAIVAALMQYVDDIRLQSLMAIHRSSQDIGRAEAKTLHALSMAGRRAYTQGRIPPLEWPAIENWRNIHEQ